MANRTFSIGGVHPNDAKISRDCAIEALPLPQTVYISLAQHIGFRRSRLSLSVTR